MNLLILIIFLIALFVALFIFRSPIKKVVKEADKAMDIIESENEVKYAKKRAEIAKKLEELGDVPSLKELDECINGKKIKRR